MSDDDAMRRLHMHVLAATEQPRAASAHIKELPLSGSTIVGYVQECLVSYRNAASRPGADSFLARGVHNLHMLLCMLAAQTENQELSIAATEVLL